MTDGRVKKGFGSGLYAAGELAAGRMRTSRL
jgi:hypothetical protein